MAAFSVAGFLLILAATRWGIGASPDSVAYLGTATSALNGLGWSVPFGSGGALTQSPPLFPGVLALAGGAVGSLEAGARGLQALLMAANVLLVAAFLFRVGGRWTPIVGVALAVTALPMLLIHSMAWSEPLFVFLGFSGLLVLGRASPPVRSLVLALAAGLMGLACLTRLAGVAFVLTGVIALLAGHGTAWHKGLRAATFGAVASLPILAWSLWSAAVAGSLANRAIGVHLIGRTQVQQAVGTMAGWLLLPTSLPGLLKAAILLIAVLAFAALAFISIHRNDDTRSGGLLDERRAFPREIRLLVLFIPTYVGVLVLATSFFDANVPWDDRILSPVLYSGIILGSAVLGRVIDRQSKWRAWRPAKVLPLLLVGLWIVGQAVRSSAYLDEAYANGLGFRHQIWRTSETLSLVDALPQGTDLYSNSPEAIFLYTGRAARAIPREELRMSDRPNAGFPAEVAAMRQALTHGAVVYFNAVPAGSYPTVQELRQMLDPVRVDQAADGTILTLVPLAGSS